MDWNVYWMDHRVEGLALDSGPSAMATTQGVAVLPHLKQMVDIIAHGLQDMSNMSGILFEIAVTLQNSWNFVKVCSRFTLWVLWQDEQQKVRTITALALAALAEVRPRQTSLCLPVVCAPTARPRCLMALRPSIRCYDRCGRVSWRQFCTTDFVVDRFNLCMCWNFFKGMILQIEIRWGNRQSLWHSGICEHRGKGLAAFLKAIGFIIPLMDAEHANYYTREVCGHSGIG